MTLSHHFLFVLTQRRTQQLAQKRVLLFVLPQHQQFAVFSNSSGAAPGFQVRVGHAKPAFTTRRRVIHGTIGNKVERADGGIHVRADLAERPQAAVGYNHAERHQHRQNKGES